jgi:hypothetical protein
MAHRRTGAYDGMVKTLISSLCAVLLLACSPANGQRDFDFEIGTWKIDSPNMPSGRLHLVRRVWDGCASLAELEETLPAPHFLGLMLRLFDPQSHEWRVYWGSSTSGVLDAPLIGHFDHGIGSFYGHDTQDGKSVSVRVVYSGITPTSFRTVQSISSDGGRTWKAQMLQTFTRIARDARAPTP